MAQFSLRRFGRDAATIMAQEFCRRGQYFYNAFLGAPGHLGEYIYTAELIANYPITAEWTAFVMSAEGHVLERANEVQLMAPLTGAP